MFATEIPKEKELWEQVEKTEFKDYTNGMGRYLVWVLGLISTDVKAYSKFVQELPELTTKYMTDAIYDINSDFAFDPVDFTQLIKMPKTVRPKYCPELPFFFLKNWAHTCNIKFTDLIANYYLFQEEGTMFATHQNLDENKDYMTAFNIATMNELTLKAYVNTLIYDKRLVFIEPDTKARVSPGIHSIDEIVAKVRDNTLFDYLISTNTNFIPDDTTFKVGGMYYEA